jgi:alpha/beta superfamily hydrolase
LRAAIDVVADDRPVIVAGYSFGADVALSVTDLRISRWITVAPVLSIFTEFAAAHDARPKTLIAAALDQFRPAAELSSAVDAWSNTEVIVVEGADHFFDGAQRAIVDAIGAVVA